MSREPLTRSQVDLLREVVRGYDEGWAVHVTEDNRADAERLDSLIVVELDWEEGICEILPYDAARTWLATIECAGDLRPERLDVNQPPQGGAS